MRISAPCSVCSPPGGGPLAVALALAGLLTGACSSPGPPSDDHLGEVAELFVVADDLVEEIAPLADWRCSSGVPAEVVPISEALEAGDGDDDAARLRDYLLARWTEHDLRFITLAGDAGVIPVRTVDVRVDLEAEDTHEQATVASDLYYADLGSDWDPDGDGIYGEVDDDADLLPDVALGRLPVEEWDEIRGYVDKVLAYEQSPDSSYLDRVLMSASYAGMGVYASSGLELYVIPELPENLELTKLYEDYENYEESMELTADSFTEAMERGHQLTFQMGHGNESTMGPLEDLDAIEGLRNGDHPTIFITTECLGARFDYEPHDSSGEVFVNGPTGGVAYIGHSHLGMGYPSFTLVMQIMARELYVDGDEPNRLGPIFDTAMSTYSDQDKLHTENHPDRWNQIVATLLGDPALVVWSDAPRHLDVDVVAEGRRAATFTVTTRDGEPVADALVTAHLRDEFLLMERTDADGVATLVGEDDRFQEADFVVSGRHLVPFTWTWSAAE